MSNARAAGTDLPGNRPEVEPQEPKRPGTERNMSRPEPELQEPEPQEPQTVGAGTAGTEPGSSCIKRARQHVARATTLDSEVGGRSASKSQVADASDLARSQHKSQIPRGKPPTVQVQIACVPFLRVATATRNGSQLQLAERRRVGTGARFGNNPQLLGSSGR